MKASRCGRCCCQRPASRWGAEPISAAIPKPARPPAAHSKRSRAEALPRDRLHPRLRRSGVAPHGPDGRGARLMPHAQQRAVHRAMRMWVAIRLANAINTAKSGGNLAWRWRSPKSIAADYRSTQRGTKRAQEGRGPRGASMQCLWALGPGPSALGPFYSTLATPPCRSWPAASSSGRAGTGRPFRSGGPDPSPAVH